MSERDDEVGRLMREAEAARAKERAHDEAVARQEAETRAERARDAAREAAARSGGRIGWLRFRRWRERLPFRVTGWNVLVDQEGFRRDEHWWKAEVEVRIAAPDAREADGAAPRSYREAGASRSRQTSDAVHAALTIFAARAHDHFFVAEDSERRIRWSVADLRAIGSINCRVAGELCAFCRGPLARIARHVGPIEAVHIRLIGERAYCSRPSGD